MCSTHNVTSSTQQIMTAELKRAAEVVDRVILGKETWTELFAPHDVFTTYRYYLQVVASSGSADLQLKWQGTVESRVRQLVMKLELVPTLTCAHPYTKGFDQVSHCLDDAEVRLVATGDIPKEVAERTKREDLPAETATDELQRKDEQAKKEEARGEGRTIWTTTFYIGLKVEARDSESTPRRPLAPLLNHPQPTRRRGGVSTSHTRPTSSRRRSSSGSSTTRRRWASACGTSSGACGACRQRP
jgi:poly(A) polymerase